MTGDEEISTHITGCGSIAGLHVGYTEKGQKECQGD